jgi:hypothetical protein
VIVNYFNIMGISIFPYEADAPLVIYPDTVLPGPITLEFLKPIGWGNPQGFQLTS